MTDCYPMIFQKNNDKFNKGDVELIFLIPVFRSPLPQVSTTQLSQLSKSKRIGSQ